MGNIKKPKSFDLLNSPLEGTSLIEASAGTGKTYTIAALFLRLILEKNLSVDKILVVTFTEAATSELKQRIRNKLIEASHAFSKNPFSKNKAEDLFINELVKKNANPSIALMRIKDAIRNFDEAAIVTIHGFCKRILYENSFESGSLFYTELVTEQENLKREIVEDFWRKHFYDISPLFAAYAADKKLGPLNFLSIVGNSVSLPYLKIIPRVAIADTSQQEKEYKASFNEVFKEWETARPDVEKILDDDKGLNRVKYKKANISGWINNMDKYLLQGDNNPLLFDGFIKFTSGELDRSVKKDHAAPLHRFFDICEKHENNHIALENVFKKRLTGLKAALFIYVKEELEKRKQTKNICFFDDLLLKLYNALKAKDGEKLSENIRNRFKAAMIDEFQDTDPVQYAIFKDIFDVKGNALFLIGDPKQAIYGFRGADIFAYIKAAESVKFRYTLEENWRSEPDLIKAVNTIFENSDKPFVYDEILFQPAKAPVNKGEQKKIQTGKDSDHPFHLWFVDAFNTIKPLKPVSKELARESICKAVASEISRLLVPGKKEKLTYKDAFLRPGDIAVLVRQNAEALMMQEALFAYNIPNVLYNTGDIFDSHEAVEIKRVLSGVAYPNSEKFFKAALATDMIGVTGEEINDLAEDGEKWEQWVVKFIDYRKQWDEHGFIRMFKRLMKNEDILPRLMALPDGERRNTNILHLIEVLHQASIKHKQDVAGLLKWFSEQIVSNKKETEEHLLRMESDEDAVKLVTIHKSKGMEYPVVFCPFTWDGSKIGNVNRPFMFHDESDNERLTVDLGSEEIDKNRDYAEKELLAENLRLLYVALTRAKHRCYFVWGRFNKAESSAPAYIFHEPGLKKSGSGKDKEINGKTGLDFKLFSDTDMLSDLNKFKERAQGVINLCQMPDKPGKRYFPPLGKKAKLSCKEFSKKIDNSFSISSFSYLISSKQHGIEQIEPAKQDNLSGIFAFPKGPKPGTCLHDIFEHLDFTGKQTPVIKKLVDDKLKEYGFEPFWQKSVCDMIQNVLDVPLYPDHKDFTLSRIADRDRLNELKFYFPLKPFTPEKLGRVLSKHMDAGFPERIGRLTFSPSRGFMKGFIDMIFRFNGRFFLVDWKSNFLGGSVKDYNRRALAHAMESNYYILQYHIYSLALHRYLCLRVPGYRYEKDFGGILYIFLRGIDPGMGPEFGIYRARPSEKLIKELSKELIEPRHIQTGS